ncbi:MAG: hypothetical protein ABIA21_00655 [Candidatus Aenigmatarchaeota archaeon]
MVSESEFFEMMNVLEQSILWEKEVISRCPRSFLVLRDMYMDKRSKAMLNTTCSTSDRSDNHD